MNRYRFITSAVLLTLAVSLILVSCRDGGTASGKGREVELRYATHLTMEEHDGYTVASIRNPWDTTKTLSTYLLLDEGAAPPEVAPGVQVVNVPLRNSVVYSTVHIGLLEDLGATDAVAGVCDTEYIFDPEMKRRLSSGRVADCGQSITPNIERIIGLGADAVLLSPFENSGGHGKIDQAGIPVIECADYMENSPLARAEWMRFYGRLYGNSAIADSLFAETERQYLSLKELASTSTTRPKVLMDRIYGQTWNLPAGHSTMGRMIEDAGGTNPFGEVEATGSLQLSPEKVLMQAGDADYWLIRFAYSNLTLASLASDKELYTRIKAYRDGNVYGSNSSESHIFEEVAFHPQWLLGSLISILHPELEQPDKPRSYFTEIE